MSLNFQYPVKDFGEALHVLNPNTEIDIFESNLYVNLDKIRGDKFSRRIKTVLGIKDGKLINPNTDFVKILLTGHRGSGKTIELQRITNEIKKVYLTIHINIEKELIKLSAVEPEDIYQLLVIELMESLRFHNIEFSVKNFQEITNQWYNETLFEDIESNTYETQVGAEAEAGISALIFKLRAFLKSVITSQSKETETIRRKIKANINEIISNLNTELSALQFIIKDHGFNGFLFVLDGTEKLDYELAKKIFVYDAPIINQINACFIIASPVVSLHDIHLGQPYFQNEILPMVNLADGNIEEFKRIVTKRVNADAFFEPDILDCLAKKSGGSIRQFLESCYNALLNANYEKVNEAALKDTLYDMGLFLFRRLDGEHKKILTSENTDYDFGNEKVKEMLFSLILLTHNGHAVINPLLVPFIKGSQNYLCD